MNTAQNYSDKSMIPEEQNARRVLVVDDEESILELVTSVLEGDGFDVTGAPSAERALLEQQEHPFPLIITDVRLGGMDGIELLKRLKKEDPSVEIIIMTSHGSLENAVQALRHGAYDYLTKPFDDLDFITATAKRAFEKIELKHENQQLLQKLTVQNNELLKLNATLNELANTDGLTCLYNHRYFQEILIKEIHRANRHSRKFSILFLDIDNFKRYNDTYGHVHGDVVLKRVAEIIMANARKSDIAARYGGEEFVILLPETEQDGAIAYAENIRKAVEEAKFESVDNQPSGSITASIGIAVYPKDGEKPSELIDIADTALYEAKASGKNKVCYLGEKP